MKTVGVREFRDHATSYLSAGEPLAVSKHGRVIGFYIPVERDQDEVKTALTRLGEVVEDVLKESGMSEEEFAQLFDLRRPRRRRGATGRDAARALSPARHPRVAGGHRQATTGRT